MEDSNSRKAALERAAATLEFTCNALLVALYGDLRSDTVWAIARVVCEEARDACEATREFSKTLADDGVKLWKEFKWCCVLRNLCEDLRWGSLRELSELKGTGGWR